MNQIKITIFVLAFVILPLTSFKNAENTREAEGIKWHTIAEVQQLVKQHPKKIYIDMYTDWCGWCKQMEKNTFTNQAIIKELNTDFYAVRFNAEQKEDVVFKDKTFKYVSQGNRGYHELAATLMNGQLSYPTSVFLDENLNMISPLPGYLTPDKLEPILKYVGGDHYKNETLKDFMAKQSNTNN